MPVLGDRVRYPQGAGAVGRLDWTRPLAVAFGEKASVIEVETAYTIMHTVPYEGSVGLVNLLTTTRWRLPTNLAQTNGVACTTDDQCTERMPAVRLEHAEDVRGSCVRGRFGAERERAVDDRALERTQVFATRVCEAAFSFV